MTDIKHITQGVYYLQNIHGELIPFELEPLYRDNVLEGYLLRPKGVRNAKAN